MPIEKTSAQLWFNSKEEEVRKFCAMPDLRHIVECTSSPTSLINFFFTLINN